MRYVTDEFAEQLAELAAAGLHDPATMPFSRPWTDLQPPELQSDRLRYFWRSRAETTPAHWEINLAVHDHDHQLVGRCVVHSDQFLTTATAATGSWLGRQHQGQGLGREIRHAVLHLLFAGLNGEHAVTHAWHDNTASLRVTRSLPYTEDGHAQELRRGQPDTVQAFTMTRDRWHTIRRTDIELTGIDTTREFLGIQTLLHDS
jgi:RimJ/RimL family protein N-acetyltransferase